MYMYKGKALAGLNQLIICLSLTSLNEELRFRAVVGGLPRGRALGRVASIRESVGQATNTAGKYERLASVL